MCPVSTILWPTVNVDAVRTVLGAYCRTGCVTPLESQTLKL